MLRRVLDHIYNAALGAACLAMIAIAVLVFVQIIGRIIDRALILSGVDPLGLAIPSLSDFGGFLFVAAATLALPATLRAAGHVRVTLALALFGPRAGRVLTLAVLVIALGLAGFAAWHSGVQMWDSLSFNTVSFGMVKVPLWIPQAVMTTGFALLALAVLDELMIALQGQSPAFRLAETKRSEGGH
ncbi:MULTISPECIES: TRAP transporter small permease [Roseinatronobacter]|uniref:TRAP transporter small permease protein n=1 Tax=Roseinatronobacter domitianus TaxID=2940293 RepID=A0ABT0M1X5_9RHOB|nr:MULTISPECIES: TRAP transporter small permease subunit [Roseibaca]MCL1628294.1 TRAP transporter small permease subunit [Roseibaca domitiana]